MPSGYIELNLNLGAAYVKESRLDDIKAVDTVIFDCDGVLIDIRESYDRAISKTTAHLYRMLTGQGISEEVISDEVIFLFRRSGGFNNDWDIVYGALMFLLSELPKDLLTKIAEEARELISERDAVKRVLKMNERMRLNAGGVKLPDLAAELKAFTDMLDETGEASVDRALLSSGKIPEDIYGLLKNFIRGSGVVGGDIIATFFEEIFCGPKLFEEIYNVKPSFYAGSGMIERGKPIISVETLNRLSSLIGGPRFGIASGSRFMSAKYVLRNILDMFNPKAQVFLDDIEAAENEYSKRGLKVSFKKPNPLSLFRSAWSLEPFRRALFVGDSMEDAMAVEGANRLDSRFISASVYWHTTMRDKALREFLKFGCDIIMPSVNDIPLILEAFRGRRE
jgi:phosphoglycolate phosphatase-like HAD superfamily hydrolase